MTMRPEFLVLTPEDCRKVLARNHVGRLAYLNGPSVDIEPIGYVLSGNWIFFRSAYGAKLDALAHRPFAAFEVDQVASPSSWASVVVHGTIYMIPADGSQVEQRQYAQAVEAFRKTSPSAFTADDLTPNRETVYGLHIDTLVGRMAQPAGGDRGGRAAQPTRSRPAGRRTSNGF